jgi:hypothetical protein
MIFLSLFCLLFLYCFIFHWLDGTTCDTGYVCTQRTLKEMLLDVCSPMLRVDDDSSCWVRVHVNCGMWLFDPRQFDASYCENPDTAPFGNIPARNICMDIRIQFPIPANER